MIEYKRKLHERNEYRLRFVDCPNMCRERMRFEDVPLHLEHQCINRAYVPPAEDFQCTRCTFQNKKRDCVANYGDNVFDWKCAVCKAPYAKKGVTMMDFASKYS